MKTYSKSNYRCCSIKKVFLNISQISQEKTCPKAYFLIKLPPEDCNFTEKETLTGVFFCQYWEIFKNIFFTE